MKISVALTTYNGERFLREQLDSLYTQTLLPDEVIVCDDCSTDNTLKILEEYSIKYGLQYYRNDSSLGVNANFFRAISLCHGDYICICDQDDVWMSHKIATLVSAITSMEGDNIPIAVSSLRQDVDASCNPICPPQNFPFGEQWEDTLLNTEQSQGCTMIINRCLADLSVAYYREKKGSDEVMYDVLISLLAAIFGKKRNLPDVLMYYRHHNANVVDKLKSSKKPFWKKVKDMPTYYPFLLDYRIKELVVMSKLVEYDTYSPDIREFLGKMQKLYKTKSIVCGLPIVLGLPQLTVGRKIKVLLLTPIAKLLKIIERYL